MSTRIILGAALILLPALPARAAEPPDPALAKIEVREQQARAACESSRLDEGVRILADLFAQTGDGNYIFNQGRCYQQNGRPQEAVQRFEMYLQRPDAEAAASARARQYVAEIRAAAAPQIQAVAPPPAPTSTSDRTGHSMRVAGLSVAGFGLAALGAATYFGLRLGPIHDQAAEVARNTPLDNDLLNRLNDRGDRYELAQWISIAVGATAATTGAVLTYLGVRADRAPSTAWRLTPVLAPRYAGAAFSLAFR